LQAAGLPADAPGPGNLRCDAGRPPLLPPVRLLTLYPVGTNRPGDCQTLSRGYHPAHRPAAKPPLPQGDGGRPGNAHRIRGLRPYRSSAVISKHIPAPMAVGSTAANTAHRRFPVSRTMVARVVPQGQCRTTKIITHMA